MERNQILAEVEEIFRDVLDNNDIVLNETTTADDIEEWDSLTHVQLTVAIEKHFGVHFTAKETLLWDNVGDMIESIEKRK